MVLDPFKLPAAIGRYQVLSRIGKGAMGVVFAARDEKLGRDVAIKVMNTDDEPETRARFFREAQVTSKLMHRNIVTVFDLGEDHGRPYIVMELLKGNTLNQALKERAFETLEARLDLMIQLCEGLSKAHAAGVIHRDVKPSNLFILGDGSLKILDFGIARLASSSMTRTGLVVGTPDYMSPEQARGVEVDERADVFSAAAVFYFMLTGRRPFAAPDVASSLRRVVQEDPEPMSATEAPAPLERIVTRALQKDPTQRYQRCVEMAADLIRFKRNFDTETRQIGTSARSKFDEAQKLAKNLRLFLMNEGQPTPDWLDAECRGLEERFPTFVSAEAGALPVNLPLKRARLAEIQTDLQTVVDRFSAELRRLEEQRAKRSQGIEDLYSQAEAAICAGDLDRAAGLVEESRHAGLPVERVQYLGALITDARFVASTLAAAHDECRRGDWEDAIARLQSVLERRPDYAALQTELVRIRAEHARLLEAAAREREAAQRQRQAAERAAEASRLMDLGDYSSAVRSAEEALGLIPDHAEALRIRTAALAGLERQAQAAILATRARNHMTKAVKHLAAWRLENAVTEAQMAVQLTPDSTRAHTISNEAQRLLQTAAAAKLKLQQAQDRDRQIARLVSSAQDYLAAGQQAPALRAAEEAASLDPSHESAKHVLDHIRSVLALLSDDQEHTLTLTPSQPDSRDVLSGIVGQVGEVMKDVRQRIADRLRGRRG